MLGNPLVLTAVSGGAPVGTTPHLLPLSLYAVFCGAVLLVCPENRAGIRGEEVNRLASLGLLALQALCLLTKPSLPSYLEVGTGPSVSPFPLQVRKSRVVLIRFACSQVCFQIKNGKPPHQDLVFCDLLWEPGPLKKGFGTERKWEENRKQGVVENSFFPDSSCQMAISTLNICSQLMMSLRYI